jgi:16S rRNA (guanine(966)-N(2))-methyltransferase RsmD
MRIIAGEKRGFTLMAPKGEATRPTLSRVRESIFSILGAQIIDAHIIDLFAGAGTLGLEALSRGAAHCTFLENGRHAIDALSANIDKLGYAAQSTLINKNAITWAVSAELPQQPLIIFADPPYHQQFAQKTLEALAANPTLPADSLLILQCGKRDQVAETAGPLTLTRTEKYGETIVHFFSLNP